MAEPEAFQRAVDQFSDWQWRLNNLYYITDKDGRRTQFEMNWAQDRLFNQMHFMNVILKARQLGFTTFIQLFMLDACLFNSNIRAGTIAHTLLDAQAIFRDKVKYPYDNLPDSLKSAVSVLKDSATELALANNSIIRVGTSLRSGTLQYLHVSEYGKLCAKYPEKAREVRTGALNTVQAGQVVWIESTAEGQEGHYFDLCQDAQGKQRTGAKLTPLDFKFHFVPWWENPDYEIDPDGVVIPEPFARYFAKLLETSGISLSERKQAWYVKKADTQLADMKREYPATPEEAFEASVEGAYYADHMAAAELQGRVGPHGYIEDVPVHTAWDIGVGDYTVIWFWQKVLGKIGLVGFYQNSGEGMPFYLSVLKEYRDRMKWTYGAHLLPHDGAVKEWGSGRTRVEQLAETLRLDVAMGVDARIVTRSTLDDGHNAVRATIPVCWFDAAECADGIKALKNYRKEWDEDHGVWKDKPRHDWASHGEAGFRTMAMGWREVDQAEKPKDVLAELTRPRSLDEMIKQYEQEQAED